MQGRAAPGNETEPHRGTAAMARPIIHIGYHKTATTWFQTHFYPAVRNRTAVARHRIVDAFLAVPAFQFKAEAARRTLGLGRGGEAPILCEEELCGYPHNAGLGGFLTKETAHRLAEVFPDAEIVIFIRRQTDMVAACYRQYVREGGTHRPRRYLFPGAFLRGAEARLYKMPRFNFEQFEYDRLIDHYVALFGQERVHVFCYEAFTGAPRRFLERYAARLDLDIEIAPLPVDRPVNRSYGPALLATARALNRFSRRKVLDKSCLVHVPGLYNVSKWILKAVNGASPSRQPASAQALLGRETCEWIEARYRDSNARLAGKYDLALGDFGYPLA